MYVQGLGVRRVVFWNDVNGVPFLLTKVGEPSMEDHDIVVEDCTVWNPSFACPFINPKTTSMLSICILSGGVFSQNAASLLWRAGIHFSSTAIRALWR